MNHPLGLSRESLDFIKNNRSEDIPSLAFKLNKTDHLPSNLILDQIKGWQRSANKLPLYHHTEGIVFPASQSLEQCSSEETALYKSSLVDAESVVDLSGGFGVDSYYFSLKCKKLHYVEPDTELLNIARYNHSLLGAVNIVYHNMSAEQFLAGSTEAFDLIYIDPSRRPGENKRVISLDKSEPDIIRLKDKIFETGSMLMVKTSPVLDIRSTLLQLNNVNRNWVISVKNECKELIFLCKKSSSVNPTIEAVDLNTSEILDFRFSFEEESSAAPTFGEIDKYLLEPNSALLKAGAFSSVSERFKVNKLHANTHLYTSPTPIDKFPGRTYEVLDQSLYNTKEARRMLKSGKYTIKVRNFPDSIDRIKKKLALKEGGELFVIACTTFNNRPQLLLCKRIR